MYSGGVKALGETSIQNPLTDYIGFKIKDKPSILTHYGFWAELVRLDALHKVTKSNDSMAHEHVTNYIYTHEDIFTVSWLAVSKHIEVNTNIRLTVDDINDFTNARYIYGIIGENFYPELIVKIVDDNPKLSQNMATQILKNIK